MNCSQCAFWHQSHPAQGQMAAGFSRPPLPPGFGNCRRNSPVVFPLPPVALASQPQTAWPVTHAEDLCGDFKEKTS